MLKAGSPDSALISGMEMTCSLPDRAKIKFPLELLAWKEIPPQAQPIAKSGQEKQASEIART